MPLIFSFDILYDGKLRLQYLIYFTKRIHLKELKGELLMNNNDILTKLKNALDIKETDIVEIFKTGGTQLSIEEIEKRLVKAQDEAGNTPCSNSELICFLNGFIIFKRGEQEAKPDQPEKDKFAIANNINNVLLKKLKIALSLTSEEMLNIFECAEVTVTKRELGAFFRTEGHKNYRKCSDEFASGFLKGLEIKYKK